ncbi:hypothetical protein MNBD_GAMMA15-806 [hydrothermal vent metagenome]|uniref:Uncharacterized protein n=1 Tax=hydrothermal vent metagenome TaxID=652676 RepID=A0A3B0YRY5_9ZZZZ
MLLKPQDVLVMLKLVALGNRSWSYVSLSVELGLASSQVHSAVKRALAASLAVHSGEKIAPNIRNLEEFLVHGLKYVFVPERGEMVRGCRRATPPLR